MARTFYYHIKGNTEKYSVIVKEHKYTSAPRYMATIHPLPSILEGYDFFNITWDDLMIILDILKLS